MAGSPMPERSSSPGEPYAPPATTVRPASIVMRLPSTITSAPVTRPPSTVSRSAMALPAMVRFGLPRTGSR